MKVKAKASLDISIEFELIGFDDFQIHGQTQFSSSIKYSEILQCPIRTAFICQYKLLVSGDIPRSQA